MSKDSFATIVCHEMGHVLGGLPATRISPRPSDSVEGQADYFATAKCMRRLFAGEDHESALHGISLPPSIKKACDEVYGALEERLLCRRVLWSALKAFRMMYEDPDLSYAESDKTEVDATITSYPPKQCRIDTLKAGALCPISAWQGFSFEDPGLGACHTDVTGEQQGARPRCWYKPHSKNRHTSVI